MRGGSLLLLDEFNLGIKFFQEKELPPYSTRQYVKLFSQHLNKPLCTTGSRFKRSATMQPEAHSGW
jgi:hypothetical protein